MQNCPRDPRRAEGCGRSTLVLAFRPGRPRHDWRAPHGGTDARARRFARADGQGPRIAVRVVEGSSDSLFREQLEAGHLDMLVGRFWPGEDAELQTEVLYESGFRLGVRADHSLAGKRRLQLSERMDSPWILPPPRTHTRSALEDMFRLAGRGMPPHSVETTSFLVIRSLLLRTDMICPVPVEVLHGDVQLGLTRFLPLKLDMKVPPVCVVRHARRTPSPAAETVIEQLRQVGRRATSIYKEKG